MGVMSIILFIEPISGFPQVLLNPDIPHESVPPFFPPQTGSFFVPGTEAKSNKQKR